MASFGSYFCKLGVTNLYTCVPCIRHIYHNNIKYIFFESLYINLHDTSLHDCQSTKNRFNEKSVM